MIFFGLMFSIPIHAKTIVDAYGFDEKTASEMIKKYGKEVSQIESKMVDTLKKSSQEQGQFKMDSIVSQRSALIGKIKKEYGLAYVDFGTIIYPDMNSSYTTIEGVSREQKHRLRYLDAKRPQKEWVVNEKNRKDVIDDMIIYKHLALPMMLNHEMEVSYKNCPVFHCLFGFDKPLLKPYLSRFNEGIVKEKNLILTTLSNHDAHYERRVAAAYLLGHFQNPQEILKILQPYVNDPDSNVRNAAMRVMGQTLNKAKKSDIDTTPFLAALDSPVVTDRNKALYILYIAADSTRVQRQLLMKGRDQLVRLLKLKQPNNHEFAYMILKKISGKDFGENNMKAWESWNLSQSKQYS